MKNPSRLDSFEAGAPVEEIEITPAMLDAGEETILGEVGGAPLGGFFSARDLARQVYEAMEAHRGPRRD